MIRILTIAALLAAPAALAQDASEPEFDAGLIDACLADESDETADPADCVGIAAGVCMNALGGSSTAGMSYCLGQEYEHWDGLLNATYGQVLADAKVTDAEMKRIGSAADPQAPLLKDMQLNWIAYRDAACLYERSKWGGGTGGGPSSIQCMLNMTAEQYLRLDAASREIN